MSDNPYAPPGTPTSPPEGAIASHLPLAILVALCCCPPFGIAAVVYAAQVQPRQTLGDVEGARQSSSRALTWVIVGFVAGLVLNGIAFAIGVFSEM